MEKWREDVLIHYGVKGMKWGKKKASFLNAFESASAARDKRDKKEAEANRNEKKISDIGRKYLPKDIHGGYDHLKDYYDDDSLAYMMGLHGGDPSIGSKYKKAISDYNKSKEEQYLANRKLKKAQKNLHRETANYRVDNQRQREKEDKSYTTTKSQRKKYKQSQRRHKVKKLASKFGINIKQYK